MRLLCIAHAATCHMQFRVELHQAAIVTRSVVVQECAGH